MRELDFENMSDEEFDKLSENDLIKLYDESFEIEEDTEEEVETDIEEEIENELDEELDDDEEDDIEEDSEEDSEEEFESEDDEEEFEEDENEDEDEVELEDNTETESKKENKVTKKEKKVESVEVDYKAKYKEALAPLKANKQEIQIESIEELRRLAQMGVGFNAKMANMKPLRRVGKMLEDAKLLDENKIAFMIDLMKNDKDAVTKLIKDSGINPLDIDTDNEVEYKQKTYTVSDDRLAFEDALSELQETSYGREAIVVVDTKFDNDSKNIIFKNPSMMKQLASQVQDGTYEKIDAIIESEKAKGNIPEHITYLQAYQHIGMQMAQQQAQAAPVQRPDVIPTKSKKNSEERKRKRKAASSPSSNKSSKSATVTEADIDKMNDEELDKFIASLPKN